MSSIPPAELQSQKDHLYQDATHRLSAFFIACIVLSVLFVAMRVASRLTMRVRLRADDYTIIVGTVIAIGSFVVLIIYSTVAGLGKHAITLTPSQLILFPKLNYAYNILNLLAYPIIKISILLLYRRVFPSVLFQRLVWFGVIFLVLMFSSNTLVAIFACNPIRGFWVATVKAKCIDAVRFYWATAVLNVITDVYILVLPLPQVWQLQISKKQKIGLTALFTLGGFTCIVSIIRIVYYLRFNPYDASYSFIGDAYATAGEVCLGVICACLSTLRPLTRTLNEIARSRLSSIRSKRSHTSTEGTDDSDGIDLHRAHQSSRLGSRAGSTPTMSKSDSDWKLEPMPPAPLVSATNRAKSTYPANQVDVYSEKSHNYDITAISNGDRTMNRDVEGRKDGIQVHRSVEVARE